MLRIPLLVLALATLGSSLPVPAEAHVYTCSDVDLDCVRNCTLGHRNSPPPHLCGIPAASQDDQPQIRYEQCRPPEFGYAVWVNGQQVAWCAI